MNEPPLPRSSRPRSSGPRSWCSSASGRVPATLIVNGDAPFTMADLGMISFAFGTIVVATVYALGHICGNHINPAVTLGLAATGKFPWARGARLHRAPSASAPSSARPRSSACSAEGERRRPRRRVVRRRRRPAQAFIAEFVGTFILVFTIFGVIHRKAAGRLRRAGHRPGGLRGDHPGRPDHRRLDQPGPHLRSDARPADRRRHRASGSSSPSTWSPSRWPASSPPSRTSRCRAAPTTPQAAARDQPAPSPRRVRRAPDIRSRAAEEEHHEEAHQRPGRRRRRGAARRRGRTPGPPGRPREQDHLPRRRAASRARSA